MGNQTVSDESGEDGSGDVNTEFESEEEEPSEEEPNEEDPGEEEPDEVDSGEEPTEDSSEGEGPNEENLYEQELDEVASCEVEPNEEDSCEEVSHEEEPNEEVCKGEQNDEEDQMEEPYEQISDEEEPDQESCEEEPDEEPCEEEPDEEPCEESCEEEEPDEEPCEENCEEEEPDENPEYEANVGSAAQSKSGKNMPSDTTAAPKRVSELSDIQNLSSNANVVEKLNTTGTTGKKRRSRWDAKVDTSELTEDGGNIGTKKKKTRWSNEESKSNMASPLKLPGVVINLEVPNLLSQLFEIAKKMQSGVVDDRPERERSPSPPPIYNNLGIKINTREARFRSKLMIERQKIISELIQKNPNFKPPPDYKTNKLQKKLYIPFKEYPEYNFVGLILGPCGNTHKRMEKETGAKILLRGKGAALNPKKPDPSDNEDMHVLIEADNKYSLDSAVVMVEKLLVPVEDGQNVHKLAQLRELARMKGNLRGENTSNFKKHDPCDICGEASHPTSACPLTAPTPGTNSNANQVNFLAEMGGGLSPFTGPALSSSMGFSTSTHISKPKKEIDDSNLFVGCLPHSVDDHKLMELFSPFGPLFEAKVIRDKRTGLSKGYGFVKYKDHINAATAVSQMNRHKIDGKMLSVRIAGINNNTGSGGLLSKLPTYAGPALAAVDNNPDPISWPGPPESKLPETVGGSFPYSSSFQINRSPFSGLSGTIPTSTSLFSRDLATSDELSQFPGYLKSLDSPPPPPPPTRLYHHQSTLPSSLSSSQDYHHQSTLPSSLSSSQDYFGSLLYSRDYFTQNHGSYQRPPT